MYVDGRMEASKWVYVAGGFEKRVCWRRGSDDKVEREERRRRTMVEEGSGVSKAAGVR